MLERFTVRNGITFCTPPVVILRPFVKSQSTVNWCSNCGTAHTKFCGAIPPTKMVAKFSPGMNDQDLLGIHTCFIFRSSYFCQASRSRFPVARSRFPEAARESRFLVSTECSRFLEARSRFPEAALCSRFLEAGICSRFPEACSRFPEARVRFP